MRAKQKTRQNHASRLTKRFFLDQERAIETSQEEKDKLLKTIKIGIITNIYQSRVKTIWY